MSGEDIPRIPIAEFVALGFLQEVNRRFLHPCGLALEVVKHDDGTMEFGGVWDYRDDPEGMVFADLSDEESLSKANHVAAEVAAHAPSRRALFDGDIIQPIGVFPPEEAS